MKSRNSSRPNPSDPSFVTLGQRLARARIEKDIPVEAVANELNLPLRFIKAIEADNRQALPARTFAKGYVRSYGKLLGLPLAELDQLYEAQYQDEDDFPLPPPSRRRSRWSDYLVWAVLIMLLVGALGWLVTTLGEHAGAIAEKTKALTTPVLQGMTTSRSDDQQADVAAPVVAPEPVTTGLPSPVKATEGAPLDSAGSSDASVAPSSEPEAVNAGGDDDEDENGESAPPPTATVAPDALSATPVTHQGDGGSHGGQTVQPETKGRIVIHFSSECWVKIKDAKGAVLVQGTRKAGNDLTLEGKPPFLVLLGKGAAAKVEYNGEPVTFDVPGNGNVAQFSLGK